MKMKNLFIISILLSGLFFQDGLSAQEKKKSPIVNVSTSTYSKEIAKGIVLVDYWATWCGPCLKMNPILEELATEYKGKVKIAKLDVDSNKQLASRQGVKSIPTLILYRDGKEIGRVAGVVSKEELKKSLDEQLKAADQTSRNEDKE